MKTDITIAGNLIVDRIKMIDSYPEKNMCVSIDKEEAFIGGCVSNTAADLKRIDRDLNVLALGRIGADGDGEFLKGSLEREGVDVAGILTDKEVKTSYSDAMTVKSTGERTFFSYKGAASRLSIEDVMSLSLDCAIFHIGYILLLDELDSSDGEYGTKMARLLKMLQEKGILTSVDLVSDPDAEKYLRIVRPALKFCDFLIINETEAGHIAGISPRTEGKLNTENIKQICGSLKAMGVGKKVVIHCPEAGFCLSEEGFTAVPSLDLPKGYIKGSVGAGDAFCAGALYGIYKGWKDERTLRFAAMSAACNLSASDSVSGMRSKEEIERLQDIFKWRSLC